MKSLAGSELDMRETLQILFLDNYHEQASRFDWHEDCEQQHILEKIACLYQKRLNEQHRWSLAKLLRIKKLPPMGIYLYGPVGRGKTVLMDIVAEKHPSSRKIRWHFTEFMQKIHQLNAIFSKNRSQPIDLTIAHLKQQYDYLFLDELEVTEIADAMILGRLFKGLAEAGVLVFLTSNVAPDQLYLGGLHYDRFHPFVSYIQSVFQVFKLDNDKKIDFRTFNKAPVSKHFNLETLKQLFADIATIEGYHPVEFNLNQRTLALLHATKTAVWLDFDEFGQKAYGAADYQLIAQAFKQVFLVNVPQFNKENLNECRRFITLIDCLYDNDVKLYLQANGGVEDFFTRDPSFPLPFQRTLSRLIEMQHCS